MECKFSSAVGLLSCNTIFFWKRRGSTQRLKRRFPKETNTCWHENHCLPSLISERDTKSNRLFLQYIKWRSQEKRHSCLWRLPENCKRFCESASSVYTELHQSFNGDRCISAVLDCNWLIRSMDCWTSDAFVIGCSFNRKTRDSPPANDTTRFCFSSKPRGVGKFVAGSRPTT